MTDRRPDDAIATTAGLVSDGAHALRNHIGTLRAAARTIDEDEVAEAVDSAARALQQTIERLIVVSRIELDRPAAMATLTVSELLELAARRATREGHLRAVAGEDLDSALGAAHVAAPGAWLERLLCEVLVCARTDADGVVRVDGTVDERGVVLRFTHDARACALSAPVMLRIAGAVGADLRLDDEQVRIRLPEAIAAT